VEAPESSRVICMLERAADARGVSGPLDKRTSERRASLVLEHALEEIRTMNVLKLLAPIAWGGLAISSATSVDARLLTTQFGQYASCSQSYGYGTQTFSCIDLFAFNGGYTQNIKLISTPCNGGACSGEPGTVYVEFTYSAGRKPAYLEETCGGWRLYDLDSCAC
jgi:hypothetical protein